jgi:hypothetical protein
VEAPVDRAVYREVFETLRREVSIRCADELDPGWAL